MLTNIKLSLVTLLFLTTILAFNQTYLLTILILENVWIYTFITTTLIGVILGDSLFASTALYSLCIAACEIVSLLSIYIVTNAST